jgi:hypothetical protein
MCRITITFELLHYLDNLLFDERRNTTSLRLLSQYTFTTRKMTLNSGSRLAIAELVIYIILTPVVFYLFARHGKHGLVGWIFLLAFCILRIVADGLQISDGIKQSKGESYSATGAIINSVGVSPLLLAISGLLSEA